MAAPPRAARQPPEMAIVGAVRPSTLLRAVSASRTGEPPLRPAPERKGFPQCSFVFLDVPASFLQKSVPPSNCSSVGGSKDATANKSHFPSLRALSCQESCVLIEILASFAGFPQRPFVFNNIPASFLQKRVHPSNCRSLPRVGGGTCPTANKSHFPGAGASSCPECG
jgi:hypothetical protein